jgi:hypothetical protein
MAGVAEQQGEPAARQPPSAEAGNKVGRHPVLDDYDIRAVHRRVEFGAMSRKTGVMTEPD